MGRSVGIHYNVNYKERLGGGSGVHGKYERFVEQFTNDHHEEYRRRYDKNRKQADLLL